MIRTYFVHMVGFADTPPVGCGPTAIRPVRVPYAEVAEVLGGNSEDDRHVELGRIFYHGQNDFCPDASLTQTIPSVSAGDVVEFENGEFWLFKNLGYRQLTSEEFAEYLATDRRDRQFGKLMES